MIFFLENFAERPTLFTTQYSPVELYCWEGSRRRPSGGFWDLSSSSSSDSNDCVWEEVMRKQRNVILRTSRDTVVTEGWPGVRHWVAAWCSG